MSHTKILKFSKSSVRPRATKVGRFLVYLLVVSVVWVILLIPIVRGAERDIVRVGTNYRLEDVYLYCLIAATPEKARAADRDPTFSRRIREGLPEIHDASITPLLLKHSPTRSLQAQDFPDQQ